MPMLPSRPLVALAALVCLPLIHCGGTTSNGTAPDAAPFVECTGSTPTTPVARPTCDDTVLPYMDAGPPVACTTVADCADAGTVGPFAACLSGVCSLNQCIADTDCPTGEACACSSEFGSYAPLVINRCIAAQCRTSSDCTGGAACSPSTASGCGTVTGFYCHSSADECASNADCACRQSPDAGPEAGLCAFSPQLGHFACQLPETCNG